MVWGKSIIFLDLRTREHNLGQLQASAKWRQNPEKDECMGQTLAKDKVTEPRFELLLKSYSMCCLLKQITKISTLQKNMINIFQVSTIKYSQYLVFGMQSKITQYTKNQQNVTYFLHFSLLGIFLTSYSNGLRIYHHLFKNVCYISLLSG